MQPEVSPCVELPAARDLWGMGECLASVPPRPCLQVLAPKERTTVPRKKQGPESRRSPVQHWRMRTRNHGFVPRSMAAQKQKRPTEWLGVVCGGLGRNRKSCVRQVSMRLLRSYKFLGVRVGVRVQKNDRNGRWFDAGANRTPAFYCQFHEPSKKKRMPVFTGPSFTMRSTPQVGSSSAGWEMSPCQTSSRCFTTSQTKWCSRSYFTSIGLSVT